LLYPGFTALDLVGPHYMFGSLWGAKVRLVAKEKGPVMSDLNLAIVADTTFEECPKDLTILFAPGAISGALDAMQDEETLSFLQDRGARAEYVTSVCTGSLLLGQAGLLDGYKATGHWVCRDLLPLFGAEPVNERVVVDRNRITGAGVTAGLDFGLSIVERQRDTTYAKSIQLLAEYDPTPPFNAGTPEKAGAEVTEIMASMFQGFEAKLREVAKERI
ncbi:MAG: DJ-1/PfpI family protein, partial [Pseudomonadota bacterium]